MKAPVRAETGTPSAQNRLITFYQKVISPIDGDRCQMEPSCSAYGAEAISRRGLIQGGLLTADRLMRCGFDLNRYPVRWHGIVRRFLDEVPERMLGE